jgi:hypothetical protein
VVKGRVLVVSEWCFTGRAGFATSILQGGAWKAPVPGGAWTDERTTLGNAFVFGFASKSQNQLPSKS